MITGDHAGTARAIGRDLGLTGEVLTGAELDTLDDDALDECIERTSVFARVSPEHKLRLIDALQRRGHVVAMTGDGVNDAPALKKADLGVAMGITGTEVSKEAATMVLTDDNFATIVGAVERGRTIYSNIVKFVRFQLSTTLGFALLFLLAATFGIADGHPFGAIAILWVNMIMDGPPAMALGVDRADGDAMSHAPRPGDERILTRSRWTAVLLSSSVMALGTLAVLRWAPGAGLEADVPSIAGTMGFHTFVMFQFSTSQRPPDTRSVFNATFANRWLWIALAAVALLQVSVSHVGVMRSLFDTVAISASQWLVCALIATSVLWVEELRKLIVRARARTLSTSTLPGSTLPTPTPHQSKGL
jgi:Ca2+-transporting ATPase